MKRIAIYTLMTSALLLAAAAAEAGITSLAAHGETYAPGAVIPLFVDSAKNAIMVRGPLMDTCIAVESSDSSFNASIGRRIVGSNSAVEILVGAASAPDQDGATIHIKFVIGEETFRVKAFKTHVDSLTILPSCKVGEAIKLVVNGSGMDHLATGTSGAMLDVADPRFRLAGATGTPTSTRAEFVVECTATGTFMARHEWFRDSRLAGAAADAMVRGSATATVAVAAADLVKRAVP